MIKPIEEWINTEVAKVKNKPVKWLSEMFFHREVSFQRKINQNIFYSPASGSFITAEENIGIDDKMIEVKGKKYTLREIFGDNLPLKEDKRYLVIDIFMSFYDQHFNYIPYGGYLTYEELPPIKSQNLPMLAFEKELMKGVVNPDLTLDYMYENGRMMNTIFSPKLGDEYYVIQIADFDVDKILPYEDYGNHVKQTKRFSKITLGSQNTLIIPLNDWYDLQIREDVKVGNHVEATDPLVNINWKL